jgi:hypothetical protein
MTNSCNPGTTYSILCKPLFGSLVRTRLLWIMFEIMFWDLFADWNIYNPCDHCSLVCPGKGGSNPVAGKMCKLSCHFDGKHIAAGLQYLRSDATLLRYYVQHDVWIALIVKTSGKHLCTHEYRKPFCNCSSKMVIHAPTLKSPSSAHAHRDQARPYSNMCSTSAKVWCHVGSNMMPPSVMHFLRDLNCCTLCWISWLMQDFFLCLCHGWHFYVVNWEAWRK